jgi:hypothetical protein
VPADLHRDAEAVAHARAGEDRGDRAGGQHGPAAQQQRVRAGRRDLLQVVGDRHRRQRRAVARERHQRADQAFAAREVQARGGLVEQQQLRVGHQRAGQQEPLALALRAVLEAPRGQRLGADQRHQRPRALLVLGRQPAHLRDDGVERAGHHRLQPGQVAAQRARQPRVDEADPLAQRAHVDRAQARAEHFDDARGRLRHRARQVHQRGLARAVGPEDHPVLAARDGPVDRVEQPQLAARRRRPAPHGRAPQGDGGAQLRTCWGHGLVLLGFGAPGGCRQTPTE